MHRRRDRGRVLLLTLRERVRAGVPRLLVPRIYAVVARNSKHPRANARFVSKLGQRFPDREKDVLGDVLRLHGPLPQHMGAKAHNSPLVAADEHFKGRTELVGCSSLAPLGCILLPLADMSRNHLVPELLLIHTVVPSASASVSWKKQDII